MTGYTMPTAHAGFFAVPAQHLDELARLRALEHEATMASRDDMLVRGNEFHDRATEVAVHHERVSDPWIRVWRTEVILFFLRNLSVDMNKGIFTPAEVHAMAHTLTTEMEPRLGGEAAIVEKLCQLDPERKTDELIRALYGAFKQTLIAAAEHDAGFTWAGYSDNAEAQFAERQRQLAQREAEAKLSPRTEQKSRAELQAELDALIDRSLERYPGEDPPPTTRWPVTRLAAVPGKQIRKIRGQLRRREPDAVAIQQLLQAATEPVELHYLGEFHAYQGVLWCVMRRAPRVFQRCQAYTPTQTRALLAEIDHWEAERGYEQVLDDIHAEMLSAYDRPLTASAYTAVKRVVRDAVARKNGFYIWP